MFQKQRFFAPTENEIDSKKLQLIATSAKARLALNESFFSSALPALYQQIKADRRTRYRTFFTKFTNLNLLDQDTYQLLYEKNPRAESERSALNFLYHGLATTQNPKEILSPLLSDESKLLQGTHDKAFRVSAIHEAADIIVVLGLGLGLFLDVLLTKSSAKAHL